jgi:hypothetical protein
MPATIINWVEKLKTAIKEGEKKGLRFQSLGGGGRGYYIFLPAYDRSKLHVNNEDRVRVTGAEKLIKFVESYGQ